MPQANGGALHAALDAPVTAGTTFDAFHEW